MTEQGVLSRSMSRIAANSQALIKALIIPMLLSAAIAILPSSGAGSLSLYLTLLPVLVVNCVIAVNTHRIVILGNGSVPKWGMRMWGQREISYALHTFAALMILPFVFLAGRLHSIFGMLSLFLAFYALLRVSLIFPSIALGRRLTLTQAWQASRGRSMSILFCVVLIPALPGTLLYSLHGSALIDAAGFILNSCAMVFSITTLTLIYKDATTEEDHNDFVA